VVVFGVEGEDVRQEVGFGGREGGELGHEELSVVPGSRIIPLALVFGRLVIIPG
jgi:hypothetical protein